MELTKEYLKEYPEGKWAKVGYVKLGTIYTAIGTLCRVGAIAVDPKYIPYGTRMFIVSNDGSYIYGLSTAEDCGGAIKENRIDLYFETTSECFKFGRRTCTVYFLGDAQGIFW